MNSLHITRLVITGGFLISVLLGGSCIRDQYDDCPRPFRVLVKAIDADQADITESGEVQHVYLFVFDDKQQKVDVIELNADHVKSRKPVEMKLEYPGHESLHFVAWGNVDDNVDITPVNSLQQLNDLYVKLKAAPIKSTGSTRADVHPVAHSPGDLFCGLLDVPIQYGGFEFSGDHTIVISRKTSQVYIQANHLKQWYGKEGEYTFRLHESLNSYDCNGKLVGETDDYLPLAEMDKEGNLIAPIFNTFPTMEGESYTLDILFNGEVIYSVDKDGNGKPFVPEVGRLLNIIIDFKSTIIINVTVVVTPWDEVYQQVDI